MPIKAAVFIQATVVIGASIVAGVAHSIAKPISRTLTPAQPAPQIAPLTAATTPQTDPTLSAPTKSASQTPGSVAEASPLTTPTATPTATTTATTASPASLLDKLPPGTFCTVEQAKKLFDDQTAEFIDARNPDEFAAGSIPTAFNIPPDAFAGGNFPPYLSTIASDRKIIVFCGGGDCDASLLVALKIKGSGFKDVIVFKEGYTGWTAAKLPTTGGAN